MPQALTWCLCLSYCFIRIEFNMGRGRDKNSYKVLLLLVIPHCQVCSISTDHFTVKLRPDLSPRSPSSEFFFFKPILNAVHLHHQFCHLIWVFHVLCQYFYLGWAERFLKAVRWQFSGNARPQGRTQLSAPIPSPLWTPGCLQVIFIHCCLAASLPNTFL